MKKENTVVVQLDNGELLKSDVARLDSIYKSLGGLADQFADYPNTESCMHQIVADYVEFCVTGEDSFNYEDCDGFEHETLEEACNLIALAEFGFLNLSDNVHRFVGGDLFNVCRVGFYNV